MTRPALPRDWPDRHVVAQNARAFGKVETDGANRGFIPDYVVKRNGYVLGEYYCMDGVGATGIDTFKRAWPMLRSGSCQQQREDARKRGALVTRTEFDSLFKTNPLLVRGLVFLCIDAAKNHAHHTGVVGNIAENGQIIVSGPHGGWLTIEANAADPQKKASRNGDGWYAGRERGHPGDETTYEFIDVSRYRP